MPLASELTWRVKAAFFLLEHGGTSRISPSVLQLACTEQPIIPSKWASFRIRQSQGLLWSTKTCFWAWWTSRLFWVDHSKHVYSLVIIYAIFLSIVLSWPLAKYWCFFFRCDWSSCGLGRSWNYSSLRKTKDESGVYPSRHEVCIPD